MGDQKIWERPFTAFRVEHQRRNCINALLHLTDTDVSNIVWLIHTRSGVFIGTVLLTPNIPRENGVITHELAVVINPHNWSDRVAMEAVVHVIMYYKTCNILRSASAQGSFA